jgi:hypothetical protein
MRQELSVVRGTRKVCTLTQRFIIAVEGVERRCDDEPMRFPTELNHRGAQLRLACRGAKLEVSA